MVKRSLLAAQKGNGGGTYIRGLRAMHLSTNTVEPINVVPQPPAIVDKKRKATATEPKKSRKKAKLDTEEEPQQSAPKIVTRSRNALIENIYGAEEAAKKRRIMETKSLAKVTTVREAFEVCLFKAERAESDAERTKEHLQQAIEQLALLRKKKAKLQDITRCEDQVRQLRAKITKARAMHQTPIDVLVNVAKFSLANAEKKEDGKEGKEGEDVEKEKDVEMAFSKEHDNIGSIATISLAGTQQHLQKFLDLLIKKRDAEPIQITLPKMEYNWCNPFAVRLAKQFVEGDSIASLHWQLQIYNYGMQEDKEEEEEEDDDDDEDLIDDTKKQQWLAKNEVDVVEQLMQNAHVLNHPKAHSWDEVEQELRQMQAERAKIVANRLMSLFFKDDANLVAEKVETSAATVEASAQPGKKEISLVKIGQLQKSAAIGGKTRNRVRNKMKPARNTVNVSIMNFLRVEMHERSDKHVAAARFITYMQNFETQRGEKGSNHSMFSSFVNQEQQQQAATAQPVNPKKRKLDALIGDCKNAGESLPLPNYASPKCVACGAPVHISKRTGMETCTSPSCAAAVYRPTGFDIVHLEQQIHNTYQYLLTVHMKSTLRRVQGKESAMVPKRVKDAVKERLEMERVDIKNLTPKKVKDVLKKLDLSAWYNHRHKICASITGRKPYQFTAEEEDVILAVFERLIEPYNLYRPKTDENFPYYRYALHKILQLLGYPDDVLRDFPILKSRKNHQRKETIWKKMMDYHGWPPYKS